MKHCTVSGDFIRGGRGELLLLMWRPARPNGCVLVVPAFAEEMNKCRRMVSETARALCEAGMTVLVPDLHGTGDSAGEFSEARWAGWEDDLAAVCAWGRANRATVTSVIAVRLGGALAMSACARGCIPPLDKTVFWHPVFDGSRFLTQMLRLRTAATLTDDASKESVADLRAKLQRGETLEVAGYDITPGLAADVERLAAPERLPDELGLVYWMELVRDAAAPLGATTMKLIDGWASSGKRITARACVGDSFWAAVEITTVQEMIEATVTALKSSRHDG